MKDKTYKTKIYTELVDLLKINSKTKLQNGDFNESGLKQMGDTIQNFLKDVPLEWKIVHKKNASPFYIASTKVNKEKPLVVLSAHMDTVYEPKDVKNAETNDQIFGSGAQDLKGSLIVIIEVIRKLHIEGKLENIILALSPEEETATPNYRNTIEEIAKQADYVLVYEPTLNSDPNGDLTKRSIVTSRRGINIFELEIEGPGGHSGVLYKKEERKSTVLLMSEIVLELEKLADYNMMTSLNSGVIHGGDVFNIIAPKTKLDFEVRFMENTEHQRVLREINKIIAEKSKDKAFKIKLKDRLSFPAMVESEKSNGLINICQDVAKEQEIILELEKRGGGSEASLFQHFNPNAAVIDGFGVRGDGEHTVKEFIYKDSIFSAIEFNMAVIKKLLK